MTSTSPTKASMRMEYQQGFAISRDLEHVLRGYKERSLMRNELRVYAAKLEHGALPATSKVDIVHIINKKAHLRGIKRLTEREIAMAEARLGFYMEDNVSERSRPRSVSRRALRLIAQGRCTKVEAALLFMYSLRRITQSFPRQRLKPGERYARFKLALFRELAGVPKANGSRALAKLRAKGFLGVIEISKGEEYANGLIYVDGPVTSLVRTRQSPVRQEPVREKTTTDARRSDNTPRVETTTISKKVYLQRIKKEIQFEGSSGTPPRKLDCEFERIRQRAAQMKAEWMDQAA